MCSAATGMNVSEVFWFARKSIVYPTAPLYDIRTRKFTPECLRALKRIFRMCQTEVRQPLRLLCCFVSVFPSAAVPRAGLQHDSLSGAVRLRASRGEGIAAQHTAIWSVSPAVAHAAAHPTWQIAPA